MIYNNNNNIVDCANFGLIFNWISGFMARIMTLYSVQNEFTNDKGGGVCT